MESQTVTKAPTDSSGKLITFTGNENFVEYTQNFKRFCQQSKFADIFDPESLASAPKRPDALLQKRRDGIETTAAENTIIKEWREYHSKHTEMAGCVLGLLRQTLSQPLLQHLKHHHDVDSQPPSINEINRILSIIQKKYGAYNHYRAQRSLHIFDSLPGFTDSESVSRNFDQINLLQQERESWSNLNPIAPEVYSDRRFTESQLKENLLRMMKSCDLMKTLWLELRQKETRLTYADMCLRVSNFATTVMLPDEEEQKLAIVKSDQQPQWLHQVT